MYASINVCMNVCMYIYILYIYILLSLRIRHSGLVANEQRSQHKLVWPCAMPGRKQRDRQMRGTRIAAAIGVLSHIKVI